MEQSKSNMATQMSSQKTPLRKQEKETYGEENNLGKSYFKAQHNNRRRRSGSLYSLCAQNWLSSEKD